MKPNLLLMCLAAGSLVSCVSNAPYGPVTRPERTEFREVRLEVYPEDVRKDPARYARMRVAWAGIIASNDANDEEYGGKIRMETLLEHHYFDWEQDERVGGVRLVISPRGEGLFRVRWSMNRKDPEASCEDAMNYAAPGKLAIVYGTPESVDEDGTIVLRYHYTRILDVERFTTNELDYGRVGEPFRPVGARPKAAAKPPSH
jgi:hypothetical protein